VIRGIIFDCFGVLYLDASRHFYEHHIREYERLRPELMNLNKAYDYGLLSQGELDQAVADLTGLELLFVSQHIQGVHRRNQQLLNYTQTLRPAYKIGMLSNIGIGAMDGFFTPPERKELFDAVVLSGEESLTKPHPHIFELAAERLGLRPDECVMIDDIEENCNGADAAGMKTILYQSNAQVKTELTALFEVHNARIT
jgi:epoxide hydrolase-like predicted phosphatase